MPHASTPAMPPGPAEPLDHTALLTSHTHPRYPPQQPVELTCQVNLLIKHSLRIVPEKRR